MSEPAYTGTAHAGTVISPLESSRILYRARGVGREPSSVAAFS